MITISNLSKRFKLYARPRHRLMEMLGIGNHHQAFWALRHINLEIPAGRAVGIIGQNGAGKSTLLKLITGTLLPTEGTIVIAGRVAALLELGTGFHPEFTGRQNIAVNGQLLGLGAEEVRQLEPEIIDFSELGPFIDQPLRTYSSGMVMRLGFSIAAAMRPEVLIVDEALSVGDARFSQKCTRRIREFRESGATILFVSHDPAAVASLCDEAVLLHQGTVRSRGTPRDVLEEYNALLAAAGEGNRAMTVTWAGNEERDGRSAARRSGTFEAMITRLDVLNEAGHPCDIFTTGDSLHLRVSVLFLGAVHDPTVGFLIRDRLGLDLYGTNTALQGIALGEFRPGDSATIDIRLPLRLGYGDYSISLAVHSDEHHLEHCYEWADQAAVFRVREVDKPRWSGLLHHEPTISHTPRRAAAADIAEALEPLFAQLPPAPPLEGHAPTPWLSGFLGVGTDSDGAPHRWTRPRATLVMRMPAAGDVHLRVAMEYRRAEELAAGRVTVELLGSGSRQVFDVRERRVALAVAVPRALAGRMAALAITVDPVLDASRAAEFLGIEGEAGVAVYGAGPAEPNADWPVVTPRKN
jgi:lipopolysaccharide transport system ATP-binding protein